MFSFMKCLYLLDINISCQSYFLRFCRLSFCLVDVFLCCSKTFKYNLVPFVYFCFYFLCFKRHVQKILLCLSKNGLHMFSSRSLMVICLQFSSLSHVRLFANPWIAAHQTFLSITNSRSLPKRMSIKLVMPSSHLILCRPLLLPSIPPSFRVFTNE